MTLLSAILISLCLGSIATIITCKILLKRRIKRVQAEVLSRVRVPVQSKDETR